MEQYTYLIIGGGMAADAAARGIREKDSTGRIGIISNEPYPCYDRPPLSKGLWMGTPLDAIWSHTEKENVTFHLERKVVSIDPQSHIVTDHVGNTYWYKKLLLATGGKRNPLPDSSEGVAYLHTLQDYYKLRTLYENGSEFVVIGGGYIGTEVAAALQMNGKNVTLIIDTPSLLSYKVPQDFSEFLSSYYQEKGVTILSNEHVTSVKKEQTQYLVTTKSGKNLHVDGVIAGVGITPNIDLAKSINLKCDNGITVDRQLRTCDPDIYAAGDVANFYSPHLGMRMRCEHEDAAKTMGKLAGLNMAGAAEEYTHLPYFYSDLFELGYMAVGRTTSQFQMVEDWQELYRQGTIYYLDEGKIVGGMCWGIWDQIDTLREQIASKKQLDESLIKRH